MAQSEVGAHGRKRPAQGELDDQPLAKRFGRLQIGPFAPLRLSERPDVRVGRESHRSNDAMMLDDTKHTVYIHDLDQELAESGAVNSSLTILPGLDDRLSISRLLVSSPSHQCNELVLYKEPESLSIPKDRDQVRRALIETRERARLDQSRSERVGGERDDPRLTGQDLNRGNNDHVQIYGDKMDIDADVQV